jgi:hypothetical protein
MSSRRTTSETEPVRASTFWPEIIVYSILIVGYLLLVLKTLDRPLANLYQHHRVSYAFAAVLLILLQGIVLELLTKILVGLFRPSGPRGRWR